MSTKVMSQGKSFTPAKVTCSTLSFSRTHLQQVAEENVEIGEKGKYLNNENTIVDVKEALDNSIKNCKHYHHSEEIHPPSENPHHETKIYVIFGLCIKTAVQLKKQYGRHVGVLNSSHATTPGGKFKTGCLSHESCICRGSLLWPCLTQYAGKRNTLYSVNNKDEFKVSPSGCAIYSPNVPVIRKDSFEAQLLDKYKECSFVSLPPPNAFGLDDISAVETALREHLYRALSIFAEQSCEDLVLCSYGCGTRGNDPKMVAKVFSDILKNELKGYFKTIVFAINPRKDTEYDAFMTVFDKK